MNATLARFTAFLREKSRINAVIVFFAVIYVISQASIAVVVEPVGSLTVLHLQTTLSVETFRALVDGLYTRGVVNAYIAHYYYDFLHPLWYAGLLALLLARGFERQAVPAERNSLLLVPFVAGLGDLLENSLHLYMVLDTANISPGRVLAANGAAIGKWTLVAGCIVAILALWLRPPAGPASRNIR